MYSYRLSCYVTIKQKERLTNENIASYIALRHAVIAIAIL